ncbi:putative domain KLRAQ/TTKRSYEDQ N-terminal [Trinorchestia longiramus]|nr:putative domain KLRAQ/TTKRSYEDQ N-terminal [Trinorchestia longiramus]
MTEVSEQQAKYQKLAAEYSKVRAQNQVLKKAVLEEQQKTCKHSEVLQALRRAEQEKDSLSFRNQQLSCRLSLLQDDLQHLQVRGQRRHSSSGGGGGDNVDVVVLMQELQVWTDCPSLCGLTALPCVDWLPFPVWTDCPSLCGLAALPCVD